MLTLITFRSASTQRSFARTTTCCCRICGDPHPSWFSFCVAAWVEGFLTMHNTKHAQIFMGLVVLDTSCHWCQMCSSGLVKDGAPHKSGTEKNVGTTFLVLWFYKCCWFFGCLCVSAEFTYSCLCMTQHAPNSFVLFNNSTIVNLFWVWTAGQIINPALHHALAMPPSSAFALPQTTINDLFAMHTTQHKTHLAFPWPHGLGCQFPFMPNVFQQLGQGWCSSQEWRRKCGTTFFVPMVLQMLAVGFLDDSWVDHQSCFPSFISKGTFFCLCSSSMSLPCFFLSMTSNLSPFCYAHICF